MNQLKTRKPLKHATIAKRGKTQVCRHDLVYKKSKLYVSKLLALKVDRKPLRCQSHEMSLFVNLFC